MSASVSSYLSPSGDERGAALVPEGANAGPRGGVPGRAGPRPAQPVSRKTVQMRVSDWRAMASSSLVGTTSTVTFESGVEMTRGSSERTALSSGSISTPM